MLKGIGGWLIRDFIGSQAASIRDGARGPALAAWFRWAIARKRVWGFFLMLLAYGVAATFDAYSCPTIESAASSAAIALCETVAKVSGWIQTLAGILIAVGFVDKDWRNPKQPAPEILKGLMGHAAIIGTVGYGLASFLSTLAAPWAIEAHRVLTEILLPVLVLAGIASVPARMATPRRSLLAAAQGIDDSLAEAVSEIASRAERAGVGPTHTAPPVCSCGQRMELEPGGDPVPLAVCKRCGQYRSWRAGRGWTL